MIVTAMIGSALLLPLFGIVFFRLYEEQLIHSTESELIAQSAALSATMSELLQLDGADVLPLGAAVTQISHDSAERWHPTLPDLVLSSSGVLGEREDAKPASTKLLPAYRLVGEILQPILRNTQKQTLAGFRILDFNGQVIAGRQELGLSLAHIKEVQAALSGRYMSVLRARVVDDPKPIYSISRGTKVRIFTAMPVIVNDHLAGVIYASRTPSNIVKELYTMRGRLGLIAGAVVLIVGLMVAIFTRAILNPIHELTSRAVRIGKGERSAIKRLDHYGSREVFQLSNELFDMSSKLFARQDYINTFAAHVSHELKSPLTAIKGAVELLQDQSGDMNEAQQKKFLANILEDTHRSSQLLDRLRQLAIAENPIQHGSVKIATVVEELEARFQNLSLRFIGDDELAIGIAPENAAIILSNLIENAANHKATKVEIQAIQSDGDAIISVYDNGSGISSANAEKIFDLFFTTRREANGTGMGLSIVEAVLRAHDGQIRLQKSSSGGGTVFEITVPVHFC